MAPTVKQMEDNVTRMEKDPRTTAMLRQGFEQTLASEQKIYQERLVVFEKRFPSDPKPLIADRLRQFLDETRNFPFEAKLVPGKGGKFRFADSQLEAKPFTWKLCYRAGREPVEALLLNGFVRLKASKGGVAFSRIVPLPCCPNFCAIASIFVQITISP